MVTGEFDVCTSFSALYFTRRKAFGCVIGTTQFVVLCDVARRTSFSDGTCSAARCASPGEPSPLHHVTGVAQL